jgi:3-oxoacyl-[acyl-carrier-protein] synthase II
MAHDVVITGVGLVSALGVGGDDHLAALTIPMPVPVFDAARHAPLVVHPAPAMDFALQIPKREQRQMELWQKLGVYAAGLALDHAGLKDSDLCKTMDMVVAAGGGERDLAVDAEILSRVAAGTEPGKAINAVLTTELRPTLFLAQLSNLLAGNISIVHKVTGSSRTFMGEESAGISALKISIARIRHGQSTHALVGGSTNGEDADMLLPFELAGQLSRDGWKPVWQRAGHDGIVTGSGGAFLVLESRQHAENRGARILAAIGNVAESRVRRNRPDAGASIAATFKAAMAGVVPDLIISGASGFGPAVALETQSLDAATSAPRRAPATLAGFMEEPQMIFGAGLAALALAEGAAFSPFSAYEAPLSSPPATILVETVGATRGEGAVLLEKA